MSAPRSAASRWKAPGAALCASLTLLFAAVGCGNKEREAQLSRLESKVAKERAAAVRALGALALAGDDELWPAVERAARDTSAQVKLAAVESLGAAPQGPGSARGALADDALSRLLADPDEVVRSAAARALGKRCGPKPIAYLQGAFHRGSLGSRPAVASALFDCGVKPESLFAHTEELRRTKAREWLERSSSAQRAWAAGELGLLGREQDVALLETLLDDEDGAVVAAAALGLGRAGAQKAAGRLAKLAGDEVPMIAAAAANALAELGPEACKSATAALAQQSVGGSEAALPAARALSLAGAPQDSLCWRARLARSPAAAAWLARGCPPGPLGERLARLVPAKGPLDPDDVAEATPLLEALLQTRPEPLSAQAALALGRLAAAGAGALSERAAEAAGLLGAQAAAPALLSLVRAQRVAREREVALAAQKAAQAPPPGPAAPAAAPEAGQGEDAGEPPGDAKADKYARLMKLVADRTSQKALREGASERLAALLRGEASPGQARKLLSVSLRSLLALGVPHAAAEAALLAGDPDPDLAALAASAAAPAPAPNAPATTPAAAPGSLEAARRALWSVNGAERAAACALLADASDEPSAPLRAALSADPERRVRAACSAKKETGPAGAR